MQLKCCGALQSSEPLPALPHAMSWQRRLRSIFSQVFGGNASGINSGGWLSLIYNASDLIGPARRKAKAASFRVADSDIMAVRFRPGGPTDQQHLIYGCQDGSLALWDVSAQLELQRLPLHQAAISCCCFSEDGWMLAAGDETGLISCWDLRKGLLLEVCRLVALSTPGACNGCKCPGEVPMWLQSQPSSASDNLRCTHPCCRAHQGRVTGLNLGNHGASADLLSCGEDGRAISTPVTGLTMATFAVAFVSLAKAEAERLLKVLRWHIQQGIIQVGAGCVRDS